MFLIFQVQRLRCHGPQDLGIMLRWNRLSPTTVDLSRGIGATRSASSSDVNITGDAGKRAIVAEPARRFGIKGLTLIRAPT